MKSRTSLLLAFAFAGSVGFACDENPSQPPLGGLEITTSAPGVEPPLTTSDGWTVKIDRFLVHVSAVTVAGEDGVVAASATPQILDQVAPSPKSLLAAENRIARAWERVSLQIGPATTDADTTLLAPVTDVDRDTMQQKGLSLAVAGSLTKEGIVKTFAWGFTTDTLHKDCSANVTGNVVGGLVVPRDGTDTADVRMSADVLFSEDLAAPGQSLGAAAIAGADANSDGVVTLEELHTVSLEAARAAGATYRVGAKTDLVDLGALVEELSRYTVRSFRADGQCVVESVPAR